MSAHFVKNKLSKDIRSLCFEKDDLRKLLNTLQLRANFAGDIEYQAYVNRQADNLEKIKEDIEFCKPLRITIKGEQSEELFGTIEEVFNSVSFPEIVTTVFVNSDLYYSSVFQYSLLNSFQLLIDFTKPKVFDFSFQATEKTLNSSNFLVQGYDNTWVNGVFHEIDSYIKSKPSSFPKIHKGGIYDLLVWFLGIPIGFWMSYKVIELNFAIFATHSFLECVFLTYIFFLSLFTLRLIFHYFRWVYPMIEFKTKKSRSLGHQAALFSITLGIIGKLIYDMVKLVFTN